RPSACPRGPRAPQSRRPDRDAMRTPIIALALLICAAVAVAADYEVPQNRQAKDVLPSTTLKRPDYRIADVVVLDGYSQRWTVTSDYAASHGMRDSALRKLLKQIRTIGQPKNVTNS